MPMTTKGGHSCTFLRMSGWTSDQKILLRNASCPRNRFTPGRGIQKGCRPYVGFPSPLTYYYRVVWTAKLRYWLVTYLGHNYYIFRFTDFSAKMSVGWWQNRNKNNSQLQTTLKILPYLSHAPTPSHWNVLNKAILIHVLTKIHYRC